MLDAVPYDAGNAPDVPVAEHFTVILWKTPKGEAMEENVPPFGWRLPDDVPRFVGVATAVVQTLGGGPGVPIPYRFAVPGESPGEAFKAYPGLAQSEGQKAFQRWSAAQGAAQIIAPGGRLNGHGRIAGQHDPRH